MCQNHYRVYELNWVSFFHGIYTMKKDKQKSVVEDACYRQFVATSERE